MCVRASVCTRERERERECESERVCVYERERERVCESVCVCVSACVKFLRNVSISLIFLQICKVNEL